MSLVGFDPEHSSREVLIEYLMSRVWKRAGLAYAGLMRAELNDQPLEVVRRMAALTYKVQVARSEKLRAARAARKKAGNEHTS
jgi:hypothetical protein